MCGGLWKKVVVSLVVVPSLEGVVALSTPAQQSDSPSRRLNYLQSLREKKEQAPPKTELTPQERDMDWAAKIIENHQAMKKDRKPLAQPVRRIPPPASARPPPSQQPTSQAAVASNEKKNNNNNKGAQRRRGLPLGNRVQLIPEIANAATGMDVDVLLEIFDGSLGRLRLALRSASDAMLSVTGEFRQAEPTDEPGVLILRGDGVECVLDAASCASIDFTHRENNDSSGDNNNKHDQYAVTIKRSDGLSFLSALLGADNSPVDHNAVKRWQYLRDIYGTPSTNGE